MAAPTHVSTASQADIAADMDRHRATYRGFLSLLKWVIAGGVVVLAVLFYIFN